MGRLSVDARYVPHQLDEVVHAVRYQSAVVWAYQLRVRRVNVPVSMLLAAVWGLVHAKGVGAPWGVSAAAAVVLGLLCGAWVVVWQRWRWGRRAALSCQVDFAQRVVRRLAYAPPHASRAGSGAAERWQDWYVHQRADLNSEPLDVWSIGVVPGEHAGEWRIEFRHRSKGPLFLLAHVQPVAFPSRSTAYLVDALVDGLCQRLGVRRSGSRLVPVKRRQ